MTREEFIEKMEKFDIDCSIQRRSGMCGISHEQVWDVISDPNYTKEMFEAAKEGVTVEELREYKKLYDEKVAGWGVFYCDALTAKGEQCHEGTINAQFFTVKEFLKEVKKEHYCTRHKMWSDSLFKHASIVTIEEKNKKKCKL